MYQSVRFVILDIDDNAPVFKHTPYKIDISENTPINTVIFDQIEAIDLDGPLYNKFQFSSTTFKTHCLDLIVFYKFQAGKVIYTILNQQKK